MNETTPTLFKMDPSPQELAVVQHQEPSVGQMLQALLSRPQAEINVAVMERAFDLYVKMEERNAEKDFAKAFAALQADMPRIIASKVVPDKHGNKKFTFAPYEEIMDQVAPLLMKHGFTVTFSMDFREARVIQTCTLQHVTGHKRSNQFAVRIGSGPPGASEAQADGAASTYAKRFALCGALNITIEQDSDAAKLDAKIEGDRITRDEVQFIREEIDRTGSNEATILRMAGVERVEDISRGSYPVLIRGLSMKKAKA